MTTILFAGGETGAFQPTDSSASESTNIFTFDATYARCSIFVDGAHGSSSTLASGSWTAQPNGFWHHWMIYPSQNFVNPTGKCIRFFKADGTEVFYINISNTTTGDVTFQLFYKDNTQVGQDFTIPYIQLNTFDLHLTPTGATIYTQGNQRTTGLKSMADVANITHFTLCNVGGGVYGSEFIVADDSTISMRCQTLPITAAGDLQQWSGNYTDINEIIYDDGHFISSATAAQVSTYTQATLLNSDLVLAIVVTARAATNALAPQNLQLAIELGSGNPPFFSGSFLQSLGYQGNFYVWNVNPDGNVPWTRPVVQSMLYGAKSLA